MAGLRLGVHRQGPGTYLAYAHGRTLTIPRGGRTLARLYREGCYAVLLVEQARVKRPAVYNICNAHALFSPHPYKSGILDDYMR